MKEIGKERKIAIAALIVAVLMLTVAFAAMSRTLKINGTAKVDSAAWDIRFTSADMTNKKGDARQVAEPVIDNGGINLTLKVGLRKPKDEITYEAVIENLGDIDAEIESIEYPTLSEDQAKVIEFNATYADGTEISKSQEINAKEEKTVKIVIRYKDITDESLLAKESYDIPLTFKINYVQKGFATQGESGGDIIDIESSPFKVTKDGVLVHYERQGNETSVVIPAEVNGIKIKTIAPFAFVEDDVIFDFYSEYAIGLNSKFEETGAQEAELIGFNFMMIDDYINQDNFTLSYDSKVSLPGTFDADAKDGFLMSDETKFYLTSVDLSNMIYLDEIKCSAFAGLEDEDNNISLGKLQTVDFPQNGVLTTIGKGAFENNKLTSINIPNSVTTIENYAFYRNNLNSLTIPESVTSIGKEAFNKNNLTTVTILGEPSDRFDSNWSGIFDSGVARN